MTNSLATFALVLVLAGSATAQQKQPRRATRATAKTGSTISPVDAARSNPSAANTHDGTNGASAGTGLTNDQYQAQAVGSSTDRPTKVDANSSMRTSASSIKARKKLPKSAN